MDLKFKFYNFVVVIPVNKIAFKCEQLNGHARIGYMYLGYMYLGYMYGTKFNAVIEEIMLATRTTYMKYLVRRGVGIEIWNEGGRHGLMGKEGGEGKEEGRGL